MENKLSTFFNSLIVGLTILISLVLTACTISPNPIQTSASTPEVTPLQNEPVSIVPVSEELIITNNTTATVYYAIFRQEILPLIEWAPCQHPDRCQENTIAPGQTVQLKLQEIIEENTEVLTVFWWHLLKQSDSKYQQRDFTSVEVKIR